MPIYKPVRSEKGLSMVVFALGIAGILGFAALAIDFGISNNVQNELQKVTTTAALIGALYMEPGSSSDFKTIDTNKAQDEAVKAFIQARNAEPLIGTAVIVDPATGSTSPNDPTLVQVIPTSRAIRMQTRIQVQTYFMAVLGITSLQVNAQSAAINCPAYPQRNLPIPNGSIVDLTDIRDPIPGPGAGGNSNRFKLSAPDPAAGFILGPPDNIPCALGPGGIVTLHLPIPIVDNPGPDIYVRELGDLEGYYIYVGRDNAGTIEWTNISCTGSPSPELTGGSAPGAYIGQDNQYKYYGSGYFDLGGSCAGAGKLYSGTINNATHLRIVDDNVENGIMLTDLSVPTALPGEHSSTSPGADIDSVAILHHSRTIDFNANDTDNDGLVDPYETIIGTNVSNGDSDGDGINDGNEISGANGFFTNPRVADTDGDGMNDSVDPDPLVAKSDKP